MPAARTAVDPDVLVAISAAIRARQELRFDHTPVGADAAGPPRHVQPHHLVARGGRGYLVAWDLDRDDWRVFRADRMAPRPPPGPRFVPCELPGGSVAAFVTARFRGSGDDGGDWPAAAKCSSTSRPARWPRTSTVSSRRPDRPAAA